MELCGSVKVKVPDQTGESINTDLNNIGYGGFCISAPEMIQPGTTVDFQIVTHAAYQPLDGKGVVRYVINPAPGKVSRFKTGIEFMEINKNMVTHILNKLQEQISAHLMSRSKIKPIDYIPF